MGDSGFTVRPDALGSYGYGLEVQREQIWDIR